MRMFSHLCSRTGGATLRLKLAAALLILFAAGCGGNSESDVDAAAVAEPTNTETPSPSPEPTAIPDPTATVDPTPVPEPTATAEPTAEPEPAPTTEPEPTAEPESGAEADAQDDSFVACVEASPRVSEDLRVKFADLDERSAGLADALSTEGPLIAEELQLLAKVLSDCGLTDDLAVAMGLPGEEGIGVNRCMDQALQGDNGGAFLIGLLAMGEERPVPEAQRQVFVDQMNECAGPEFFSGTVIAAFASEPEMADIMDVECVRETLLASDFVDTMWQAMAEDPQAASFYAYGEKFGEDELLGCISMGGAIALAASQDGVDLSAETIGCIDTEIAEQDLIAQIESGAVSEAALSIVMIDCMTPEEFEAMGG